MPKKNKIIIADDHPLLLKGLTEELISNNYNVIETAEDGKKALALILKHKPDIAILDIQMPLLSGFDVIKKCVFVSLCTPSHARDKTNLPRDQVQD